MGAGGNGETATEIRGIPASPGVAVGRAKLVTRSSVRVQRRRIDEAAVDGEVDRLRRAIDESRKDIEQARKSLSLEDGADFGLVLDAHLLMHKDELLVDAAVRSIQKEHMNAEWALSQTFEGLAGQLSAAGSEYFRDRAQDVVHVGTHILRWLTGAHSLLPAADVPFVVVADDLSPAEAARLAERPVLAIVTELGTATSHTAILARALRIPALVGVAGATEAVEDGDEVVVDALRGAFFVGVSVEERARAEERSSRHQRFQAGLREQPMGPTKTADGTHVRLFANLEIPAELPLARDAGTDGVGLYRTEFLYLDREAPPTEEDQRVVYEEILRTMRPLPVTFRTFDLGGDKLPERARLPRGPNPALGLRAVRLSLAKPELLIAQVRAVLRAAREGEARLMFPLVATIDELRDATRVVDEARADLVREGIPHGDVRIGVMIEVPSAALLARVLARECDFFSVGTNDLVQYTLAADRSDPRVARLARTLHPAVLKLLGMTAEAAEEADIELAMCGDMAGDPVAIPIVLGLGYRDLSMSTAAMPLARAIVSRIDIARAEACARQALGFEDADAVRALVTETFAETLADLWEEEGVA